MEFFFFPAPQVFHHFHHFWNDVAGFVDYHRVADPRVQPFYFIFVVQRRPRNNNAGALDRPEV